MKKIITLGIMSILIMNIVGCATNRGYLGIQVPSATLTDPNGKQVYIRSITDSRSFQDKPESADIPSLGFGGISKVTPEMKSRAIARKRDTFGKALGDIMLKEGQSVQSVIYEATRNSLYSLGYDVVNDPKEAKPDAIIMDISIDKFWAWFMPGFWTLSIKSEITTINTISVPKRDKPVIIEASSCNFCQIGNAGNWMKALNMVVDDFIKKARLELKNLETSPDNLNSHADEILKYKKLMDNGVITQEEFEKKKKQFLNL
jgi:hypothetical protein